jgi:hypothetical protein
MNLQSILRQKWVIPVAASSGSLVIGVGVGFLIGVRKAEADAFNNQDEDVKQDGNEDVGIEVGDEITIEITEVEEEVEVVSNPARDLTSEAYRKATEPAVITDRILREDEVTAITQKTNYATPVPEEVESGEIIVELDSPPEGDAVNIFTNPENVWDQEAEIASRIDGEPYVIHIDEYTENENGYRQETLTYYMGDDVVCDAADTPVYGYPGLMGDIKGNFGRGSGDKNVVYVRNDEHHMEWEILRHQSSFEVEVLGSQAEEQFAEKDLQHSSSPRKFRDD